MIRHYVNLGEPFGHPDRDRELETAYKINTGFESMTTYDLGVKPGQPTYDKVFEFANNLDTGDDVHVLSNLDITFDLSILLALQMPKDAFWCLTRWEGRPRVKEPQSLQDCDWWHMARKDSQDTWIWRGKCQIPSHKSNFTLGTPGCDNRLAYEAYRAHYVVSNPSLSVKTYHWHFSELRKWSTGSPKVEPPYLLLPFCSLENPLVQRRPL